MNMNSGKISITKEGKFYIIKGISGDIADAAGKALIYSRKIGRMFVSQEGLNRGTKIHLFFLPDVYLLCREVATLVPEDWMDKKAVTAFGRLGVEIEKLPEIQDIKDQLSDSYRGKKINYSQHLKSMIFSPLAHQTGFLESYVTSGRIGGVLLNAAAGTGKTYTSLALRELLKLRNTLIVSPNQAIESVWHAVMGSGKDALFKKPQAFWTSKEPTKSLRGHTNFICHYQFLDQMFEKLKRERVPIDYIIIDESHNFSNTDSAQTKLMIEMTRKLKPRHVVLLSGTPIKAMAKEVASVFYLVDPNYDDEANEIFKTIYGGRNNGAAVDILRRRLGMVSYVIEKKALALKEPVYTDWHLKLGDIEDYSLDAVSEAIQGYIKKRKPELMMLSKEYKDEFYQLVDKMFNNQTGGARVGAREYRAYLRDVGKIIATTNYKPLYEEMRTCSRFEKALIKPESRSDDAKRLKAIKGIVKYPIMVCVGEALGKVLTRRRIDCFKSMVEQIDFSEIIDNAGLKTVIFTSNIEVGEAVYNRLVHDYHPLRVYGDYTKDLASTVKLFGESKVANPLIATYASLSTAVPLIMANTEILIDLPFREFMLNQAISRVHRIGNETGTFIHKFTIGDGYPDNLVSRNFDIISWAKSQAEAITGVASPLTMLNKSAVATIEDLNDFDGYVDRLSAIDDTSYFDL